MSRLSLCVSLCKGKFLYIAQCPVFRTALSYLQSTPWQTCSFQHNTRFLQEAFSHAVIATQGLLVHTYPPLSIARFSFTQPNELGRSGVIETAQALKRHQKYINPGFLNWQCVALITELLRRLCMSLICQLYLS